MLCGKNRRVEESLLQEKSNLDIDDAKYCKLFIIVLVSKDVQ